jgi:hypothetical protein
MDCLSVHHKVGTFPFYACELEHSYLNIALKGFFVLRDQKNKQKIKVLLNLFILIQNETFSIL